MCTVYEFPVKKELPEEIKEMLVKSANDYIESINKIVEYIYDTCESPEEFDEFMEMMMEVYTDTMMKAVDINV